MTAAELVRRACIKMHRARLTFEEPAPQCDRDRVGAIAGAFEFLTKPFREAVMLSAIGSAIEHSRTALSQQAEILALRDRYASLSRRKRQVMVW
jgi:hypothetical protein